MEQKLFRSRRHRVISGVCGGLGRYFSVDPIVFRFAFIAMLMAGGSSIIVYLILLIIIPKEPLPAFASQTGSQNNASNTPEGNTAFDNFQSQDLESSPADSTSIVFGLLLISGGALLLLHNLVPLFNIQKLWPASLVIIGLGLIFKKSHDNNNTKA